MLQQSGNGPCVCRKNMNNTGSRGNRLTEDDNMTLMRLQKFLSSSGVCSRRKGEEFIRKGLVSVNGNVVTELGTKVDPGTDRVEVAGKTAEIKEEPLYVALNKPAGYVTTCSQEGERIVLDLVDLPERVYPVGRLDKDSIGLLLLTNDGRIHHRLSHPSFDHEKEYEVTVDRAIGDKALAKLGNGIYLDGVRTRPARVKRVSPRMFRIVLKEGKNRQIRRMVQKVGCKVAVLKRLRVSNILLGKLGKGRWRHLTEGEKKELLKGL